MGDQDLVRFAVEAVGAEDPTDYRISPTSFLEETKGHAPDLATVLSHSSLSETARRYDGRDAEALAA